MSKVLILLTVTLHVCASLPHNFQKVNLKFIHGHGSFNNTQYSMQDVTQFLSHRSFRPQQPTVLFVSGWMMSPDAETSQLIIKAYLKRGDYNVLVLDWSDYSVGAYPTVMIRISKISRIFGKAVSKLFDKGLNIKSFHCVGHSFGAHSCGIMGRELYQVSNRKYKFGRITGLDPAGPGFFPAPTFERPLNREDGQFVDAIHSDVFFIGTKYEVGHADFYTNFNAIQPTCPSLSFISLFDFINNMCSHFTAIRYWVDTLNPKYGKLFPSYKCSNYQDYEAGKCSNNQRNLMGIEANPKMTGKFFITVKSKYIYNGKGFYEWLMKRIGGRLSDFFNFNLN